MDNKTFSFDEFNKIEKEYNNISPKYNEYKQKFIKEFTSKKSYKQFLHSYRSSDVDVESCNITYIKLIKFNDLYYINWDDYLGWDEYYNRGDYDVYSTRGLTAKQIEDFLKNGDTYYKERDKRYNRLKTYIEENSKKENEDTEHKLYEELKKKYEKS